MNLFKIIFLSIVLLIIVISSCAQNDMKKYINYTGIEWKNSTYEEKVAYMTGFLTSTITTVEYFIEMKKIAGQEAEEGFDILIEYFAIRHTPEELVVMLNNYYSDKENLDKTIRFAIFDICGKFEEPEPTEQPMKPHKTHIFDKTAYVN